jgi:hypothetical protein
MDFISRRMLLAMCLLPIAAVCAPVIALAEKIMPGPRTLASHVAYYNDGDTLWMQWGWLDGRTEVRSLGKAPAESVRGVFGRWSGRPPT